MLSKLLEEFEGRTNLPIEVSELADALVRLGCQDSIIFSAEPTDPGKVRGVFYQYTTHPGVYAAPDFVTLIVYSSNVEEAWQRLICAKEVIHVCDKAVEKTNEPSEVATLIEKLLGPMSTENYGLADLMAAVDKLALYQALAVLFPLSAREVALTALSASLVTPEQIAVWAGLPLNLSNLVLGKDWPDIHKAIFAF